MDTDPGGAHTTYFRVNFALKGGEGRSENMTNMSKALKAQAYHRSQQIGSARIDGMFLSVDGIPLLKPIGILNDFRALHQWSTEELWSISRIVLLVLITYRLCTLSSAFQMK